MHISRLFSLVFRRCSEATLGTRRSALGTIAATAALALAAASARAAVAAIVPSAERRVPSVASLQRRKTSEKRREMCMTVGVKLKVKRDVCSRELEGDCHFGRMKLRYVLLDFLPCS